MKLSLQEQKIQSLITPVIEELGFRLVCARILNEAHGTILQVMAENPTTHNIGVDDCAILSREISALLDVEDPIDGRYRLEVSSPGIDRPLVSAQDFIDFETYEAKIEIDPPQDGQKRFRGRLNGVKDDEILLNTDQGVVYLPLAAVQKAKLVMTDELLQKAMNK